VTDAEEALAVQLVAEFQESIAPDAYSVETFVPWPDIDEELAALEAPINVLQLLIDADELSPTSLTTALESEPEIATVARRLFTAPHAVGFVDGRELPEYFDPQEQSARDLAELLFDLGLARILQPGSRVADAYRVAAIAVDSRRRGFRRKDDLESRVDYLIQSALAEVKSRVPVAVTRHSEEELPGPLRNRVGEVIMADGRPVALVANVFQAISGGRQYRDLSVTYPRLQEDLDAVPACLVLIADGRGLHDASRRVLLTLFESIHACLTLHQAESGGLASALLQAIEQRGVRETRRAPLRTLIGAQLRQQMSVSAAELPAPFDTARSSLAEYATTNSHLALTLRANGAEIGWATPSRVAAAQTLLHQFDPRGAVDALTAALALEDIEHLELDSDLVMSVGSVLADPVLPPRLPIAAVAGEITEAGPIANTVRAARQHVTGARIAILLASDASDWLGRLSTTPQRSHATSVVVLDGERLLSVVGSVRPRDALISALLEQADLTKASPFVSTGATPREMFFGRQQEAADLMSALGSGSVAVLGGRRIGKTSLLHRATQSLDAEGWSTVYADLQEAGDWATFADHVRLRWDVDVPTDFSPGALARIVAQLRERGQGRLVLVFDEVDQLLRWDQDHGENFVSEAFFRACRALSQEGSAQFVFSGERTIAERLWDPSSPHWNFCRPLPVRQLTRDAADELLERPLASLGVALLDREEALQHAWERTNGHPQIIQKLGEELVRSLNRRAPAERSLLGPDDIRAITSQASYAEHYVMTYWGQATSLERAVSAAIVEGVTAWSHLIARFPENAESLRPALRMLQLYGIVEDAQEPFQLRADWLGDAMEALGGTARVTERIQQQQQAGASVDQLELGLT
jgi:hypothetical protein